MPLQSLSSHGTRTALEESTRRAQRPLERRPLLHTDDGRCRASLNSVKSLRIFVVVILAMLLPLRGVSAAVVTCAQAPASHSQTAVMSDEHHAQGEVSLGDASPSHEYDGLDKARHCVSSCAAVPLMTALPSVASPTDASSTVFPRFAAPAPTFQSGGQDRPPRRT
jgi:hypothetical protein